MATLLHDRREDRLLEGKDRRFEALDPLQDLRVAGQQACVLLVLDVGFGGRVLEGQPIADRRAVSSKGGSDGT